MNTGDTCYLADGRKVEYCEPLRAGHLVTLLESVFSEMDDEHVEVAGGILIAEQVYRDPPAPIYHQEIARLNAQLTALETGVATIKRKHAEADSDRRAALQALSLVPAGDPAEWTFVVDTTKATLKEHPGYHVIRDRRTDKIVALCAITDEQTPICEGQFSFAPIIQRVLEHHLAASSAGIVEGAITTENDND